MKIRQDFVSNSSSSSFIIADNDGSFVRKFKLSKKDFIEAMDDLYASNSGLSYYIKDKKLKNDRAFIESDKTDFLKEWLCPIMHYNVKAKKLLIDDGWHLSKYNNAYDALRDAFDLPWRFNPDDPSEFCRWSYDEKAKKPKKTMLPKYLFKTCKELYERMGILTNHDVLMMDFSRFLFHFDDNDVYNIKDFNYAGRSEELCKNETSDYEIKHNAEVRSKKYESESGSIDRICEIFFNWFRDHGKLKNLDDSTTWKDLKNDVVACCMHEG